jgi:hypothetical protein
MFRTVQKSIEASSRVHGEQVSTSRIPRREPGAARVLRPPAKG